MDRTALGHEITRLETLAARRWKRGQFAQAATALREAAATRRLYGSPIKYVRENLALADRAAAGEPFGGI